MDTQKLAERFASYDAAAKCGYVPYPNRWHFLHIIMDKSRRKTVEVFNNSAKILEQVDNGRKILAIAHEPGETHVIFQD